MIRALSCIYDELSHAYKRNVGGENRSYNEFITFMINRLEYWFMIVCMRFSNLSISKCTVDFDRYQSLCFRIIDFFFYGFFVVFCGFFLDDTRFSFTFAISICLLNRFRLFSFTTPFYVSNFHIFVEQTIHIYISTV